MVTKGLDFKNVGLVGVINTDPLLFFPDFRAHERAFQLLTQVAGRAGRSSTQGKVLLQTFSPDHPVLQQVLQNNYKALYTQQLHERKTFEYPPFYRLSRITLKARDYQKVNQGDRVAGCAHPHLNSLLLWGRRSSSCHAESIHQTNFY